MKLVRWSFNGLHMPMMQDGNGDLWCTSKQLCEGLGITESALRELRRTNKDEFELLSVRKCDAKEFFSEHKIEFGIKRIRKDMSLWSETDMLMVAILSRSGVSRKFRREWIQFVKANAKREVLTTHVSKEAYDKLLMEHGKLAIRTENLERLVRPKDRNHLSVV